MESEKSVMGLEDELARLQQALESERASARRTSRSVLVSFTAIGLVVIGFVFSTYSHFRTEWSQDKLLASIGHEMEKLSPLALDELVSLGQDLLPVYAAEGARQFERMAPELEQELSDQMDQFFYEMEAEGTERLIATEARIRQETKEIVMRAFPDLQTAEDQAELITSFNAITEDALNQAIEEFGNQFTKDVDRLRDVIARIELGDDDEPTVELQKKFVRLWLEMFDEEIAKL